MEEKNEEKIGVFLARFQPLHRAHLYVIEKALEECDRVVVMIGSSNKSRMIRNPFNYSLRYNMISEALAYRDDKNRVEIYGLPDWSQEDKDEDDKIWGNYLYYNVVARTHNKKFTFYYSDAPNIVKNWFYPEIEKNITFRFLEREKVLNGLSSTKIRKALLNFTEDDQKYLQECLPFSVYYRVNELRGIWLDIYNNPKKDFTMK